MTLTRGQKIGIIAAAIVAIVAIIVVVVVRTGSEPEAPTETGLDIENLPEANSQAVVTDEPAQGESQEIDESGKSTVARLARVVVERNGSYSNRNNYENLTNLEPFMTERYKNEILAYIDSQQQDGFSEEFYGIATTAVSVEVTQFVAQESAQVIVSTSRVESRSNQDDVIFTQDALVRFKYVADNWKVDGITWQ